MRKFLLSASLCAATTLTSMATEEWGVVGEFNDWDTYSRVMMTEQSENVYVVTMESLQGQFKFLADNDWLLNYGSKNIGDINGNGSVKVAPFGSNFIAEEPLENVTITLDTANETVTFSGLPTDMDLPSLNEPVITEGHFLIGDPSGAFNPEYGLEMKETSEGVYEWQGQIGGSMYFSFTTALVANMEEPWTFLNAHRYGAATPDGSAVYGDLLLPQDEAVALCYPMNGDMSWRVAETGIYRLRLDSKEMTLLCDNLTHWGIVGEFNEWGEDGDDIPMYPLGDGKWEGSASNFSGEFKFRVNGKWDLNIGAGDDKHVELNKDYECSWNRSENFKMEQPAEKIHFLLDTNNLLLTTSVSTVIRPNVTVDEPVEYFNLQGMRITEPTHGIFIRVSPSGVSKVRL